MSDDKVREQYGTVSPPLRIEKPELDYYREPGGRPSWIESIEERSVDGFDVLLVAALGFAAGAVFALMMLLVVLIVRS